MRISTGLTPPGGWKYKQSAAWIYGESFADLVSWVTNHRRSNKLEIGDVEKDIEDQLLELNPSIKVDIMKMKVHGS